MAGSKIKKTFICFMTLSAVCTQAAMLDYISPAEPNQQVLMKDNNKPEPEYSHNPHKARLTHNDVHNHYEIAMQRFMQANVKSAYKNFKILISNIVPNDYAYLRIADEMAEIGLFNLSNTALQKAADKDIAFIQSEDIKHFYFPKNTLTEEDEIYLAEKYSNIMYNAQSKEAANELLKNTELLSKSDYANYIAALGFFKAGDTKNAKKYIENALEKNPNNINYQKLKIEISIQDNDFNEALNILKNIKSKKFHTTAYINKVNTLEYYTLYKTEKNENMKKYYLGYYYHSLGEDTKALRTLQSAMTAQKKQNRLIYALMAEIYYDQKEYEKAQNYAEQSLQLGGKNRMALMVLGKLKYKDKNYADALKYFKSASSGNNIPAMTWTAMTYSAMGNDTLASSTYYKILKEHSDCYLAYYNIATRDKSREYEYYKKSVSIDLKFIDGWVGLAKYSIEKNELRSAGKYLEIVKYIDENDFRYYYYQGLIYKARGLYQDANYYFKKSLVLNPDNTPAKKELGIL